MKFLRDVAVIILVAVVVSFLVKTFLVRSFYIPSASMEHTLDINDRILVNELEPRLFPLSRGDVVVFTDPGGWLPPTMDSGVNPADWLLTLVGLGAADSNDHLIKRVIGLPGDHMVCCDGVGQLTVNGTPISEPYLDDPDAAASATAFDVTVPDDSLWVMGDNRANSADSRRHIDQPGGGFVPEVNVVGRAFVITWPLTRLSCLDNYPVVFQGIPPAAP